MYGSTTPKIMCKICGRTNHTTNKCHFKGKPKCGKCGQFGHTNDKYWGGKRPNNKFADAKQDRTNVAHDPQEDEPVASTSYVTLGDKIRVS